MFRSRDRRQLCSPAKESNSRAWSALNILQVLKEKLPVHAVLALPRGVEGRYCQ
jgi:hypothetical protein